MHGGHLTSLRFCCAANVVTASVAREVDGCRDCSNRLLGRSSTIYNWESGSTKPSRKHLATLVSLRGIGMREATKRLELLEG